MTYIGDFDQQFLADFQNIKKLKKKHEPMDILGMGINDQWIVDIQKVVKKIPSSYFCKHEESYLTILTIIIYVATLEEVIHCISNVSNEDCDFNLGFFLKLIKNKKEIEALEKYEVFRFISFANSFRMLLTNRGEKWSKRIREEVENIKKILNKSPESERRLLEKYLKIFLRLHKEFQSLLF